jgi:octaprenyl-diphosphate synthase
MRPQTNETSVQRQPITRPPLKLSDIQAPVVHRLDRVVEEIRRIVVVDFDGVAEISEYLLQMRGKLFRPGLLLLCSEIGSEPAPEAETLAATVELMHLATLVHDDAVDHSVLRRGMPTVNAMWSHQVAIIMGDFLYSRSLAELARLGSVEPVQVLAGASNAMSIGEMRQLASCDALDFSEEDYDLLIDCKTASLMSAACELGAIAGPRQHRAALARYGHELGMAFQIADDLLDYTADEADIGKPAGLDLREHKVTLPLIAVLPSLSPAERAGLEEFFRDPEPRDADVEWITRLVRERGGLDYARERALDFAGRARDALDGLPDGPALRALTDSIDYAVERRR